MLSMFLLWMMVGLGIIVWIIFVLRYMPEFEQRIRYPKSIFLLMVLPVILLISLGLYWTDGQKDKLSTGCGTIIQYTTYMSAGNKHKRQPFQRVEIQFHDQQYSRHIRIDDALATQQVGSSSCFEFYDRKLNAHLQDSNLIRWLDK